MFKQRLLAFTVLLVVGQQGALGAYLLAEGAALFFQHGQLRNQVVQRQRRQGLFFQSGLPVASGLQQGCGLLERGLQRLFQRDQLLAVWCRQQGRLKSRRVGKRTGGKRHLPGAVCIGQGRALLCQVALHLGLPALQGSNGLGQPVDFVGALR